MVKNLPAMQETGKTQVRSLDGEDPLEEEMATHSSVLARKIPWIGNPGLGGHRRVRHKRAHTQLSCKALVLTKLSLKHNFSFFFFFYK